MKREIITTGDGSKTIQISEWDEQYHSKHGAIQEARHVFLGMGLQHYVAKTNSAQPIAILEMGFGTGLNALLTLFEAQELKVKVEYTGIEAYPVSKEEVAAMDYSSQLTQTNALQYYNQMHSLSWGEPHPITTDFRLTKRQERFENITDSGLYDLVYFDAFGARVQPELWDEAIFGKMYAALREYGVLVTYAAKGSVRRAMQAVGFVVERLPGPPGKERCYELLKLVIKTGYIVMDLFP